MTELVNRDLPVALISTPQFIADQKRVEDNTGWNSKQFIGRISHYRMLPDFLSKADRIEIAKHYLPDSKPDVHMALASYAEVSESYIAGIEHVARRAQLNARRDGSERVELKHVKHEITFHALPSDSALKERFAPRKQPRVPVEEAENEQANGARRELSPRRSASRNRGGSLVATP